MLSKHPTFDKTDFNGGNLSSDGGAIIPMAYFSSCNAFSEFSQICFKDNRKNYTFSNADILEQMVIRNFLGYHNQADQKVLMEDPLLSLYTKPCSQPTVSRFFQRVTHHTCNDFREIMIRKACSYVNEHVSEPIIDADSTLIGTDGHQEAAKFITHYKEVGYHPLCINEFHSKMLLTATLRSGDSYSSNGIVNQLKTIMPFLENHGQIRFRGDSAFYDTKLLEYLEDNRIHYYIRTKNYHSLISTVEDDIFSKGVEPFKYTQNHPYCSEVMYSIAGKLPRRIVYKAFWYVDLHGLQELLCRVYAVVTNDMESSPEEVMAFYEERGASENFNKELKNDFFAQNVSHPLFNQNDMEFLICCYAYNLFHMFQMSILENEDTKITMNTFRCKYQKIAVKVITHARRISLSFSSAYTNQDKFLKYWNKVCMVS